MRLLCTLSIASFVSMQVLCMQSKDDAAKALIMAIIEGDQKKIRHIITDVKPNVNQAVQIGQSNKLMTPLGAALKKKNFNRAIVDLLLAQPGIDVNEPSFYLIKGSTQSYSPPLVIATMNDYQDVVKKLLDNKALVNNKESAFGRTALHYASELLNGDTAAMISLLLDHHADIEARDTYGNTPLFYANTSSAVKTLLLAGANANAQNNGKSTPLIEAIAHKNQKKAHILLEFGADPHITNCVGADAFTISDDKEFTREIRAFYEKIKKEIHKSALQPQRTPITSEQLNALSPTQDKQAILIPEQPALRSLIAEYLGGELKPEEKEDLQTQLENEQHP